MALEMLGSGAGEILASIIFFALGLPVAEPTAGDITGSNPLEPRPIGSRPVEPRPVDPRPIGSRPVEPRPIGSRSLSERQSSSADEYIIEFKDGYTHDDFYKWTAYHDIAYETRRTYDYNVFKGIWLQLKKGGDSAVFKSWEGTKDIWVVEDYEYPPVPEAGPIAMPTSVVVPAAA